MVFCGVDGKDILSENRKGNLKIMSEGFDVLQLELVRGMLHKNPAERLSARACLEHDYF